MAYSIHISNSRNVLSTSSQKANFTMAWNIHYRAGFGLHADENIEDAWSTLIRSVRKWVKYRIERNYLLNDAYWKGWFFSSGSWAPTGNDLFFVKTSRSSEEILGCPRYWALQYFHPDDDPAKKWKVDISVETISDGNFFLSMTVYHDVVRGHIGRPPKTPSPTVPLLIKNIIKSEYWTATAGSELLSVRPSLLNIGSGMSFREKLADAKRLCPVVLVSCDPNEEFLVDPHDLAWKLAGAANVFYFDKTEVEEELFYCLGANYRCSSGAIRVYNTQLRFDVEGESRRHRFFNKNSIQRYGSALVIEMLVEGLTRRSRIGTESRVFNVNQIAKIEREQEIKAYFAKSAEQEDFYTEYIKELEKELEDEKLTNETLQDQLIDKENNASETKAKHHAVIDRLQSQIKKLRGQCSNCETLKTIKDLPNSIAEVLDKNSSIFSENIVVTDECQTSASNADFSDVHYAWQCLFSLCSLFPQYLFKEGLNLGKASEKFNSNTPFRIALTESSSTKKNKRLISQRIYQYNGKDIDTSPHITLQRGSKYLRLHFGIANEEKKIIIAHFGKHQTTAGTRRRKIN